MDVGFSAQARDGGRIGTVLIEHGLIDFEALTIYLGLELGIPINRVYNDTILEIPLENGQVYKPMNVDNKFMGPMTLRTGLIHSRNAVAIQVGLETGMDSIAATNTRASAIASAACSADTSASSPVS